MGKKWKRLLVERRKVAKSAVVEAAPVKPAEKPFASRKANSKVRRKTSKED